jgi:hypothetical protein
MQPLDFLAVVLPTLENGYYCAAEFTTKRKEHVYVQSVQELSDVAERFVEEKSDAFFALSAFEVSGSRTAANARVIKSLFMDIDCAEDGPKTYGSKKEGANALADFLETTGIGSLGEPYIINSGGGMHIYWPLSQTVDIDTWKPVAENLKRLAKQEGLKIDMTVTADAARVLRVPGTKNFKPKYPTPRPVRMVVEGDIFELDDIAAKINEKLVGPSYAASVAKFDALPGQKPNKAPSKSGVKLMENSATKFELILNKTNEGTGCAQLKNYIENATEDGMEPIWRGLLSWTQKCEDGPDHAIWLSSLHPYDDARMHQKLGEIKGPYACLKMDSENPGVCQSCPHYGKITNPLALGREVMTDNAPKEIVVPKQQVDVPAEEGEEIDPELLAAQPTSYTVTRPSPPRGFSFGKFGGVYRTVKDKVDGEETSKEVQITAYDLFVVDILKLEGEHTVHMMALRPEGPVTIDMLQKSVVSKDETVKALAAHNIIASYGQGNDKHLFDYVRACVEEASLNKRAITVPLQFGWQENGSFVYSNRVFTPDGKESTIPMPGLENLNRVTVQKGTLNGWRQYWDLMITKKMNTMLALCVDSFGSTLMNFTDYNGFVWHIGSTESGTGKSLTLNAKSGVWGHPIHYRTGKGTSPVALQQRAGLLNSLPLSMDEMTAKSRNDVEWVPALIFDLSEGQGKERMESGSNKERINNSRWCMTATMTSNTHLFDLLTGARKHSSFGEMLRMLEWTPNKPLLFTDDERDIIKTMRDNYGVAGEAWVRWLVKNQDTARAMVSKVHKKLKVAMNFSDDERYWHAACTTTVAASILLGSKYADIITLPTEGIVDALRELVEHARGIIGRAQRNAEDVLNAYTRDNYGSFVVVKKLDGGFQAFRGDNGEVDKSMTRNKVLGRVEHDTLKDGFIEYYIEEQLLKQHCVAMSFGYSDFKTQLESKYHVTYIKKDMTSRTNGPNMRVNVMHISRPKDTIDEDSLPLGEAPAAGELLRPDA